MYRDTGKKKRDRGRLGARGKDKKKDHDGLGRKDSVGEKKCVENDGNEYLGTTTEQHADEKVLLVSSPKSNSLQFQD